MSFEKLFKIILLASLLIFPALIFAGGRADMASLTLKLTSEKEVVRHEKGKTASDLQEAREKRPGDMIRYTIKYTNDGDSAATGAVIVNPVPAGTSYITNSAGGKDSEITFSLDGKNFGPQGQVKYKTKDASGKEADSIATPDMYTHIKWRILKAVPPGGAGTLVFKVKVR